MGVLSAYMCTTCKPDAVVERPEDGVKSPELELHAVCELPGVCWESNLSPLQRLPVLVSNL